MDPRDLAEINRAKLRRSAALRAVRLARYKRDRREARIAAAIQAHEESIAGLAAARAELAKAERAYNEAFRVAAQNVIAAGEC